MPKTNKAAKQAAKQWFSVKNVATADATPSAPAEVLIYDQIGKDPYDESGIGAQDFNAAIKSIPATQNILVRINSPGGNVWDGMAIYNMLHGIKDRVTCQIDGIAASSASLIALAGGTMRMPKAALLMMHNPSDLCWGDAEDMRKTAEKLDAHKDAIASIYTDNSTMTKNEVLAAMDAETWMNGEQCQACGMADEVTEDQPIQNSFDLSRFRCVPGASVSKPTAPQNKTGAQPTAIIMDKNEMIALLKNWGVTVPENSTDEQLKTLVKAGKPVAAPAPAPAPAAVAAPAIDPARLAAVEARLETERRNRITASVNNLVSECRLTATEAPAATARAIADESYLTELSARPQILPGNAPLNHGLEIVNEDARNVLKGIQNHIVTGPKAFETAGTRSKAIGAIYTKERNRINSVMNSGATNTIDSVLKRVLILNETARAFATRVVPLRAFATSFLNVPLQGTDTVIVPYYPLQTATSSDFTNGDGTGGTGYQFGQATATNSATITVNKRKYQPLDYSSYEFRRQPWFDAVRLGAINAEKLGVDILNDVLSAFTVANYGVAVATSAAASMSSDTIATIKGACTAANWPDAGRSLIVDSTVDTALMQDPSLKAAYAYGSPEVIQQGKLSKIMGFDYYQMPNFPSNGSSNLIGIAAFMSALGAAFAPIEPAEGVRAQLIAYEIATDEATGISMNYRHWGLAQADRDYEVIESAYGYQPIVAAAGKLIVHP